MNIYDIIKGDGTTEVPNPKYNRKSKKNIEPPTIKVPDNYADNDEVINFALKGMMEENAVDAKIADKYRQYGINFSYKEPELDRQLAEAQSNFDKTKNAVAQTIVSEIGLGTLKGITDLFDGIYNLATRQENDYTSPAGEKLKQWQEEFEAYAPVHVAPGTDISNGGLLDWGWWMSNMPSIASSLTLLIPSTGLTKAVGYVGKGLRLGKGISSARKFLTKINKLDKAVDAGQELNRLQKVRQWANNKNTVDAANRMFEFGLNGFTSRIMENYQEANQVYNDLLPEMWEGNRDQGVQGIKDMSEEDYQALVQRNSDVLQGVDTSDRMAVTRRLAKKGADTDFRDNLWNGVFDVYQLYGLKNLKALKNAPMRASIRRDHLNSIRYAGKSKDEIKAILDKRSKWAKGWEKVKDYSWGAKQTFMAEASEGVEEAINYIAQEEGYHYGHVLLGTEDERDFWDDALREYMMAPQLYESAFWGVMGGVVFQGAGSALANAERAIKAKSNKQRHTEDEKTKEKIQNTSWSDAFESPEIRARRNNIEARAIADTQLKQELESIENKKDPWAKKGAVNADLTTPEEQEISRQKAYDKRITNLLFNAMTVGNWDITREYLESNEVKRVLVDAGIVTQEQADEMQARAKELGDRLENLYNANLRAIGNAMRGVDEATGANLEDIPIEYFQIIAAENTKYQLEAERFQRNIDAYQPGIASEEERLKEEIEKSGIDYKASIRSFILAKQLGEIQSEIDAAKKTIAQGRGEKNADLRTVTGQNALRQLEMRKQVLSEMLYGEQVSPNDEVGQKAIKAAKVITAMRAVAATESDGNEGYRMNINSQKYRDLDAAIVNAFNSTDEEWETNRSALVAAIPNVGFENFSLMDFQAAARQADIFNENLGKAFGENNAIESLDKLSSRLLDSYAQITHNEIARNVSLQHVAKDRDSIIKLAHDKHNHMNIMRAATIEYANENLKALAKKYHDELGDISEQLAYGTLREDAREFLKDNLSSEDMAIYDDIMAMLALNTKRVTGRGKNTSPINVLLPEMVKDAVYRSELDEFEEVDLAILDRKADEEVTAKAEDNTSENSSINQNQSSAPQTSQPTTSSPLAPKASSEPASTEKIDFTTNTNGMALPESRALVTLDDDGNIIKLEQFGPNNDTTHKHDVSLKPVEGQANTYKLDYKGDLEKYPSSNPFKVTTSGNLFNIKQSVIDGGTITRNPQIVIDDDGSVVDFRAGEIKNPEDTSEETGDEETGEGTDAPIPSTGEEPGVEAVKPDPEGEAPAEIFENATAPSEVDMGFEGNTYSDIDRNIEELKGKITEAALLYINAHKADGVISEEAFVKEIEAAYKDKLPDSDYESALRMATALLKRKAKSRDLEFQAIADFAQTSAIFDKPGAAVDEGIAKLDAAFKAILDNFVKRAYVDEDSNGVKWINLESLLRYANDVAGGTELGNILFDRFVNYIAVSDKYAIMQGRVKQVVAKKQSIVHNATRSNEERFNIDNPKDGRRLAVRNVVSSILNNNELTDEQKQEKVSQILDIIYSLKPGDEVEIKQSDYGVKFVVGDTVIGNIAAPRIEGGAYRIIHSGWQVDVPTDNDGTIGRLQTLFSRIMINPDNEAKLEPILKKLNALVFQKNGEEKNKALVDLIKSINDVIPLSDYVEADINDDKDCIKLGKYLLSVYRHPFNVRRDFLAKSGLTADELAEVIRDNQQKSINNWFDSLREGFAIAHRLIDTNQTAVRIDHIFKGGPRITQGETLACNDPNCIGSLHKDSVQILVASITDVPTSYVSDGSEIRNPNITPGSTRILIPRDQGAPALFPAYPQSLGSDTLGDEAKAIVGDVFKEFNRLLDAWGNNVNMPVDEIERFLNQLVDPMRDRNKISSNNPLFKGLKVTRLTNGFSGLNIAYQDNGVWKNILLFDEGTDGQGRKHKVSYIRIGKDRPVSVKTKEKRDKIKTQLKSILEQAITFNIEFSHVSGSTNLAGFASRSGDGKFTIKIGKDGTAHTFNSYRDFVLSQGILNVATRSVDGKTNFHRSFGDGVVMDKAVDSTDRFDSINITFTTEQEWNSINPETPPVEGNDENTPVTNKGDKVKDLIEARGSSATIDKDLSELILSGTRLKLLKNSRLLRDILLNNIIFVPEYKNAIAAHIKVNTEINGRNIPAGSIIVTQKLIDKLNEDDIASHEEAFRHLVHEGIHKKLATLSKAKRTELFNELRTIFDDFVKANNKDNVDEWLRNFEYENDRDPKTGKRVYHNEDGTINEKGLEEFLVESLTRPGLIERLNSISADGKKITKQKIGSTKSKSLLQRILAAIAKIFDLKINKGSLLEKEYKLFAKIENVSQQRKEAKPKTNAEGVQLTIPFEEESNNTEESISSETEKNTDEEVVTPQPEAEETPSIDVSSREFTSDGEEDLDDLGELSEIEDENDHTEKTNQIKSEAIEDKTGPSLAAIRESIIPENREAFERLINDGIIQIKC